MQDHSDYHIKPSLLTEKAALQLEQPPSCFRWLPTALGRLLLHKRQNTWMIPASKQMSLLIIETGTWWVFKCHIVLISFSRTILPQFRRMWSQESEQEPESRHLDRGAGNPTAFQHEAKCPPLNYNPKFLGALGYNRKGTRQEGWSRLWLSIPSRVSSRTAQVEPSSSSPQS